MALRRFLPASFDLRELVSCSVDGVDAMPRRPHPRHRRPRVDAVSPTPSTGEYAETPDHNLTTQENSASIMDREDVDPEDKGRS